eukprot:1279517-Pyramimonas_sp.AAC.1
MARRGARARSHRSRRRALVAPFVRREAFLDNARKCAPVMRGGPWRGTARPNVQANVALR